VIQDRVKENWQIKKTAVTSHGGLVASQHHLASDVGASILAKGGNAIDAAIATGLALGTVEPWMSGIGGGGYMTVYLAKTDEVKVVEFGMRAPFASVPADYPLAAEGVNSSDSFGWPKVEGDANIHGPLSIAVPGYIKGIALALETFGTQSWESLIEPACKLAEWGLPIDWYSSSKVNTFARELNKYDETRSVYLNDGFPPVADIEGEMWALPLGELHQTYRHLQLHGPDSYYTGSLAENVCHDLNSVGSKITPTDLAQYQANIATPLMKNYRGSEVFVAGNLTAGPSLMHALDHLEKNYTPDSKASSLQPAQYESFANGLLSAYDYRLKHLGAGPDKKTSENTTHICVTDSEGNVVSLTQTIMSGFGSRVMLPQTGILMNNGMMWFDPRPGSPNSVEGGRYPLCNMCPTIVKKPANSSTEKSVFAVGACGGRKIFPSVFQLVSFMVDNELSVDEAVHRPRIDNSGSEVITIMDSMPAEIVDTLMKKFPLSRSRPNGVSPNHFALPQLVEQIPNELNAGGCFIPSPHAKVSRAEDF
jgi:gamma-glutamyltranspeptidase/glutathione hydrolase